MAEPQRPSNVAYLGEVTAEVAAYRRYRRSFYNQLGFRPSEPERGGSQQYFVPPDGQPGLSPKPIGFNQPNLFELAETGGVTTKFGDADSQGSDLKNLGARFVRQDGRRDLTWGRLTSKTTAVPLEVDLPDLIVSDRQIARFAELLSNAREHDFRLILTFLTLGGGTDSLSLDDPNGKEMSNVLPLAWDPAHAGMSAGGEDFYYLGTSPEALTWCENTLDPRSAYKRHYFGLIAAQCAELLERALATLPHAPADASSLIAGIEIFNEIDGRCTAGTDKSPDYATAADWWAQAYVASAKPFYSKFGSAVPILMPGVSSYLSGSGDRRQTWSGKLEFVEAFATAVVKHAGRSHGRSLAEGLAAGLDYHWYQRAAGDARHIGYLLSEVAELEAVLEAEMPHRPFVTVHETGMAVTGDFRPKVFREGQFGFAYPKLDGPTFQSQEVWRRLGGVLASNATSAAWHCWMSLEGDFVGTGVRVDTNADKTTDASAAVARPSWFAYQRLVDLLAAVTSGSMVLPRLPSGADFAPKDADSYLVVFEYVLAASSGKRPSYAYLVFYDPTGPADGAYVSMQSEGLSATVSKVATLPTASSSSGGSTTTLPLPAATFEPDYPISVTHGLRYAHRRGESPVLYLADSRLHWFHVETFVGSG